MARERTRKKSHKGRVVSIDVTPNIPTGKQVLQSYGDGGFRIAGVRHEGSVLVFPEHTAAWNCSGVEQMSPAVFQAVVESPQSVEILLIGCGATFFAVPKGLRAALKEHGIAIEWMDTGAACRTVNVLLAEERRFAAALVAID